MALLKVTHFWNNLLAGVPAQFSNLGVPAQFFSLGVPAHFWSIRLVHVSHRNLWIYIGNVLCDLPMHGQDTGSSQGG